MVYRRLFELMREHGYCYGSIKMTQSTKTTKLEFSTLHMGRGNVVDVLIFANNKVSGEIQLRSGEDIDVKQHTIQPIRYSDFVTKLKEFLKIHS